MAVEMVIPEREELEPEVSLKSAAHFTQVPCGDHLSKSRGGPVARLQKEFSDVF